MPRRLALITGHGDLVPQTLAAARAAGWEVALFDMSERTDLAGEHATAISFSDVPRLIELLRASGASHMCAVGALEISDGERQQFGHAVGAAPGINDGAMMDAYAAVARACGMTILGVDELIPSVAAPEGHFAGPAGKVPPMELCANALRLARAVGALDMGQAVIVSNDRVVAAEGIERTAGMIDRVADYVRKGLVDANNSHVILAKALKPHQPRYVDMPAIGPDTVQACASAGIAAIVVEAGGTLLIERDRLERIAGELGIAMIGVTPDA